MGLHENMLRDSVAQLNLREPILVTPDVSIREAILLMRARRLGCVIVVDEAQRPVGMFTEGILRGLLLARPEAIQDPVRNHMDPHPTRVQRSDPIARVLEAMQRENVRFVCVLDDQGRTVGLTGQKGPMEYIADHFPGQVMVQRIGTAPFTRDREGA